MRPRDALKIKATLSGLLEDPEWVEAFLPESLAAIPEIQEATVRALRSADVFAVGEEMFDLSVAASETFPVETLLPEDMPFPGFPGLLWFGGRNFEPDLDIPEEVRSTTHAISWIPVTIGGRKGVHLVTWWHRKAADQGRGSSLTGYRRNKIPINNIPDLTPSGQLGFHFGEDWLPVENEAPELAAYARIVGTIWRLMQQSITTTEDVAGDQGTRGALASARVPNSDQGVKVIHLRRRQSATGAGNSGRTYVHRWFVEGHWRKQPYKGDNGQTVIRNIYINPYLKGPEGAPLLVRPKVYALTR